MIGDTSFRMPAVEGIDLGNPDELMDYFGSVGSAIAASLQAISEQMNDARYIQVAGANGSETLNNALSKAAFHSGDVKLFLGTVAQAGEQRRYGWVPLDGNNGTPEADDRYFKAPPADTDPGSTEDNTVGTTTRLIGVQGCSPAGIDASGAINAVTLLPLMKL